MATRTVLPKISAYESERKSFGIEWSGNRYTFINMYSKDNRIIDDNEECYFLVFNTIDFHRPLIAKGRVLRKDFFSNINALYQIELIEFVESEQSLYDYAAMDTQFVTLDMDKVNAVKNKKLLTKVVSEPHYQLITVFHSLSDIYEYSNDFTIPRIYFSTQAFMVRDSLEEIVKLKKDYVSFVRKELLYQIKEIDRVLEGTEDNDKEDDDNIQEFIKNN